MKTTMKFNVKGIEMEIVFEGSIKELMGINTACVKGVEEWMDLAHRRGDELFDMINHGIERAGNIEKKIHSKEKEVKYFKSIIDKNMK